MFARILSRFWWIVLLRGVLSVAFGIILFAWPGLSLVAFIRIFGLLAIADGVGNVISAVGGRSEHENWGIVLLAGLVGIGVGVLTFSNPGATALVVVFYLAIWVIAAGVLQIAAAFRLRKEIEGELLLMLGGLASVGVGMYLMARPGAGVLASMWLVGAHAIVVGVILIVLAFKVRGFVGRFRAAA